MSYEVRLTPLAEEDLKLVLSKHFPVAEGREQVLAELHRLGENPNLGQRVVTGPAAGRMAFTFVVARPPGAARLTVFYKYGQDERTLWVLQVAVGRIPGIEPRS